MTRYGGSLQCKDLIYDAAPVRFCFGSPAAGLQTSSEIMKLP